MSLDEAQRLSQSIFSQLSPYTLKTSVVGSIRRKEQNIGDLDLLVELRSESDVDRIKAKVSTFSTIHSGASRKLRIGNIFGTNAQADIWMVYPPRNFYALLAIFTGPDHITIKLRNNLERKGVRRPHSKLPVKSEKHFFELANLPFVPPEDRHKI